MAVEPSRNDTGTVRIASSLRELTKGVIIEPITNTALNILKPIYPSFLVNWYPDFLDADNYIQPFLECVQGSIDKGCESGSSQNQGSFYYNKKINELIGTQRKEQNPEKRKAIFVQIQDILAEDVPYIPLWQTKEYLFAQKGLEGVKINPSQNIPFWTIKN